MKLNKTLALSARKGFTLVELLVVIAIIAALAGLSYGPIMKQINAADRTEAISNGRSINTALLGFYANNDAQYPRAATARPVLMNLGDATDAWQQLFDAGLIDDEKLFWNRTNARAAATLGNPVIEINEPDNDGTLDQDENTLNYVTELDAGDGTAAIFFDSLIAGGNEFTAETWDGKAIIGYVDGSVEAEQIAFDGPVQDSMGVFAQGLIEENGNDILAIGGQNGLPAAAEIVAR